MVQMYGYVLMSASFFWGGKKKGRAKARPAHTLSQLFRLNLINFDHAAAKAVATGLDLEDVNATG